MCPRAVAVAVAVARTRGRGANDLGGFDDAGRGRRVREGRASARRSRGERDGAGTDHLGVGDQQVGWIDLSPRVRRGGRARGDARDAIGRQRDAAVGERVALDARDRAKGFADAWVRWDRERGVRYV